ncbi:hypothetical protein [Nocardioides baculatus]|uniref:Uncharacterized protein n=1 Tax=Nocardioides baculatus TaxID=2801337 RepID=A0ABS1LAT1_9ACTN|nr:hypothetical protein [Nocardioides baculatus]MBL0748643.1 hypothetical protein [Nocardioides baculatus]
MATAVTPDDLDWVADALRRRREALVPHAPVFWRPAPDADARHRSYLHHLLTDGGARAWRTSASVLIAAPAREGWLVDDFACVEDGIELWNAFATACAGDEVRFVAPTYETARAAHAATAGLEIAESWWLRELDGSGGGTPGVEVDLPGADAATVAAPPVYAPPGPMLFLPSVTDGAALPDAVDRAPTLGCAGVVVSQRAGDQLDAALGDAGFRRHCDFFEGVVRAIDGGARSR